MRRLGGKMAKSVGARLQPFLKLPGVITAEEFHRVYLRALSARMVHNRWLFQEGDPVAADCVMSHFLSF